MHLNLQQAWRRRLLDEHQQPRIEISASADLHGLNAADARELLRTFIADSVARHMTCVRVIHGKGRGSGPRGPVLKHMVNHWLQRFDAVMAFASARAVDGGSGAVYVLLRPPR